MMPVRILLAALLLALTSVAASAPSHAQSATEIVLQLDGASVRDNELAAAAGKARAALSSGTPVKYAQLHIEGSRLLLRMQGTQDVESAMTRLRETLEGYDIILRIDGAVQASLADATFARRLEAAGAAALTAADKRVKRAGYSDVSVTRQNVTQLLVTIPAAAGGSIDDIIALLTTPGIVTFNIVNEQADPSDLTGYMPLRGHVALPNASRSGELVVVRADPIIGNDSFASASAIKDAVGMPGISFTLTPGATQVFGRATTQLVGRRFAVVIDGRIASAPTIMSPITSGKGEITGEFTVQEAERLAVILNSPPMPARLVVTETRTP